ncbi:MAG: WXG100 family type VII secretion target [Anaerolineae bacterium]|nr:WXG100 family type VII secretion target [Anaerolineae bacterium]
MPSNKVQCNYEDMEKICQQFIRESDETEGTIRILKQGVEELRGGGWLGVGANAFYAEMDDHVFPNLDKLVKALQTTESQARQAIAKLHEMEDSSANKFKNFQSQLKQYVHSR